MSRRRVSLARQSVRVGSDDERDMGIAAGYRYVGGNAHDRRKARRAMRRYREAFTDTVSVMLPVLVANRTQMFHGLRQGGFKPIPKEG